MPGESDSQDRTRLVTNLGATETKHERKLAGVCSPCAPYRQSILRVFGVIVNGTSPRSEVLVEEAKPGIKYPVPASDIFLGAVISRLGGGVADIGVDGAEAGLSLVGGISASPNRDMWCWSDDIENTERNKEGRLCGGVGGTALGLNVIPSSGFMDAD